ncbi:cytochrome P450 2M1-like [Salminus brasiliensis]|uniref:cytochrome P450 2M1-like n=1 Tax=Salminus brasiliensis TaxID=930266 RepID=UPI003B839BFA
MELFLSNVLCIAVATAVFFLFWKSRRTEYQKAYERLPPGPSPAPLVGNYFQLRVKEPYKHYLKLSEKYGSIFTLWFANTPVVVISGYQALKDSMIGLGEEFSGRANYPLLLKVTEGYGVMVSNGDRWKQLRRFCITTLKNFGMGRQSIEEKVKEEASYLVQTFSTFGDSAFNPRDLLSEAVCNVICSVVLGRRFKLDDPQLKLFIRSIDGYFSFLSGSVGQAYNIFPRIVSLFPGKIHEVLSLVKETKASLKLEVEARRKTLNPSSPPQDFIEAFLIRMEEEKHNTNTDFNFNNLLSTLWSLFSAGTETTSSTIRQGLLLMMKHPDIQAKIQKEIDEVVGPHRCPSIDDRRKMPYTDAVIHEVQRRTDIAPTSVPHKMLRDTEFNNYLIPKGAIVLPLLSSVLTDPKLWKNPNHFDPENFLDEEGRFKKNDAFVPFGMGKRACLGEALARVEVFIFITSLLQHFTFKATDPPEQIDTTPLICSFGRLPRSFECYAVRRT